jgi:RNA-binding protein 5/10
VQVPPPGSHGAAAAAAFYRALAQGGPHAGRRVKIDFSQSAHPAPRAPANDGTRDIGAAPASTLLVRGLDPQVGPAALAAALRNGADGAKGMTRIVVIKDKTSLAGWGFAFVEFVDVPVRAPVPPTSLLS